MPSTTQEEVLNGLRCCYDPEIPVNIVDLGLFYGVKFDPAEDEKQDVTIDMTLTSPGCPAHVTIGEQDKDHLQQLTAVRNASVIEDRTPTLTPVRMCADVR